jgi:phage gp46-like protein
MSLDRIIDPIGGDLISAPKGKFYEDDVILNKLTFSVSIPLDSWEGDETFGHRLNEMDGAVDNADNRLLFAQLAELAFQWMVDEGDLVSVTVEVDEFEPGGVAWQATCLQPGQTKGQTYNFFTPWGA